MAKELKKIVIRDLEKRFGGMEGCVVIDYQGLNSEQTTDLREMLRKDGVTMSVVHNRFAKIALEARDDVPGEFYEFFRGPTALLVGEDGVLSASKGISRWRKKNKGLARIKGGLLEGQVLSEADVERFATVPDRDTLLAQVAAMFISPMQYLASSASSLLSHFLGAAQARREDLESKES